MVGRKEGGEKRARRTTEDHSNSFEEGPLSFKCSTSCREVTSAGTSDALPKTKPRKAKQRGSSRKRKGFRFPHRLAICVGGYLLRLAHKKNDKLQGGPGAQGAKAEVLLPLAKPRADERESKEYGEEVVRDRGETVSMQRPNETARVETALEPLGGGTCSTVKQIKKILAREKKSREDVLAFTMQQSALRSQEKDGLRNEILLRDREIERNSETIDRVLTTISQSLGINFSDVQAMDHNSPCSKQSSSESTTSPEAAMTPKLLMKENNPEIWKIKQELILDKITEMAQRLEEMQRQRPTQGLGQGVNSGDGGPLKQAALVNKGDGNFSAFLQNFRVEQFQLLSDMKDKETQLKEYSSFVSKWHEDVRVMKEKQAEHYQCEVDNLVEQQRSLEESHEKDLARMAQGQSEKVREITTYYESQLAEKESEIQQLSREFERQSDHLHQEIFGMEEKVQDTLSVAIDMEHDINVLRNKNAALKAKHKQEIQDMHTRLTESLDVNEALASRIDGLLEERSKSQSELAGFLSELSNLSTADLLPGLSSQSSFGASEEAKLDSKWLPESPTSSLDMAAIRKSLFQEDSMEIPSLELLAKVSVSDRYDESS